MKAPGQEIKKQGGEKSEGEDEGREDCLVIVIRIWQTPQHIEFETFKLQTPLAWPGTPWSTVDTEIHGPSQRGGFYFPYIRSTCYVWLLNKN